MRRLAFALAACLGAAGAARAELNQGRLGDAHPVVGRRRGVALGRCSTSRADAASVTRTPCARVKLTVNVVVPEKIINYSRKLSHCR